MNITVLYEQCQRSRCNLPVLHLDKIREKVYTKVMKKDSIISNIPHWQWLNSKAKKHAFLAQGNTYFQFPFLMYTRESWRYYGYAVRHMVNEQSWFSVLASPSFYTGLISLLAISVGHLAKSLIGFFVTTLWNSQEHSKLQPILVRLQQSVVLHNASKSWASYDYFHQLAVLRAYAQKQKKLSGKDRALYLLLQCEYRLLGLIAHAIQVCCDLPEANSENIPCYVTYAGKKRAEEMVCERHLQSGYDCHKSFKKRPFLLARYDDKEHIVCKVRINKEDSLKPWSKYLIVTHDLEETGKKEGLVCFKLNDRDAQQHLFGMMHDLPLGAIEAIF